MDQRIRAKVVGPHPNKRCEWHGEPRLVLDCGRLEPRPEEASGDGPLPVPFWYRLSDGCAVCPVEDAGVPPDFLHCSFDTFQAATPELVHILARAREFSERPAGFLFLLGGVGTGKTHLAVSCIRAHGGGLYTRHLKIVEALRESYDWANRKGKGIGGLRGEAPCRKLLDLCRCERLMVLDELGVACGGNDAETALYDILDHRLTNYLPTVLCANIDAKGIEEAFGSRIADRFRMAKFDVLNFQGASFRRNENEAYLARARRWRNDPPLSG